MGAIRTTEFKPLTRREGSLSDFVTYANVNSEGGLQQAELKGIPDRKTSDSPSSAVGPGQVDVAV